MQIARAAQIGGWMSGPELEWLAEQASKCLHIAEVGVWMGRSLRAMADNTRGTVFAVDIWAPIPALGSYWRDKTHEWLFDLFTENTKDLENVVPIRATSLEAAKVISADFLDMVFIDADHSYEAVKADILAWSPKVKQGGLLCGHDYDDPDYGVTQAVNELLLGARKTVGAIWACTKS